MDSKIVIQFAGKLGLQGETNIIEKTKELLRLLEVKGTSLTQIGDYARCVICLDLATSQYGHEFDAQTALKLSGYKKPSYLNNRRIIEKLLELSKPTGVQEICVQLGLTEIQDQSKSILEQFTSSSVLRNVDTTHPQYAAMAVYQMCKLRKIKIQKTKLISYSHLKSSQWALLEKSWETWAKNNADTIQKFQLTKKGLADTRSIPSGDQVESLSNKENNHITVQEKSVEEYSEWRERVLKKAFEDLERQQRVS